MSDCNSIVIVGAGISGLALGWLLTKAGKAVTLVERESTVGGLARSFHYDGFTFDIGPHRFRTEEPEIVDFIRKAAEDRFLNLSENAGVYLFGRYFDWPLSTSGLFKLPLSIGLKALPDLLLKRDIGNPESYTEYIISKYGRTLYRHFFKHYTEKFVRIPCEEVHADWALTGIDRTVADKRIHAGNLSDLAKGALLPRKVNTKSFYPEKPGIGIFTEALADFITSNGGSILTDTSVEELILGETSVTEAALSNGEKLPVDRLVWSGELHSMTALLGLKPAPLKYLSMVCYNIAVKGSPTTKYQWMYFGDRRLTANRASIPGSFNQSNCPSGFFGVSAEITCYEGDGVWRNPQALLNAVRTDILSARLARDKQDIQDIWVEKVRNTYPVYDLNYKMNLGRIRREVDRFENVTLLGRNGRFWYNNMDHCIKMALDITKEILTGEETAGKYT